MANGVQFNRTPKLTPHQSAGERLSDIAKSYAVGVSTQPTEDASAGQRHQMLLTLAEIAGWHARNAKAATGADHDFHTEVAKFLLDLAKRRTEHGSNITAALAAPGWSERHSHAREHDRMGA
jgi:hypothetical protein